MNCLYNGIINITETLKEGVYRVVDPVDGRTYILKTYDNSHF
jgi:hypothetical protein